MHLKIDCASPILGRKFTVFLCFTLYLRAISKYKPPGGLIFGGSYTWRGLFLEFYSTVVYKINNWLWGGKEKLGFSGVVVQFSLVISPK